MAKSLHALGIATQTIDNGTTSMRAAAGNPPSGAILSLTDSWRLAQPTITGPQMVAIGQNVEYEVQFGVAGPFSNNISKHEMHYTWGSDYSGVTVVSQDGKKATLNFSTPGYKDIWVIFDDGFNTDETGVGNKVLYAVPNVGNPATIISFSVQKDPLSNDARASFTIDWADPTIGNWTIDWGDGTQSNGTNSSGFAFHTYAKNGEYDITLTADNGFGVDEDTVNDFLVNWLQPTVSVHIDEQGDWEARVHGTVQAADGVTEIRVDWGDGSSDYIQNFDPPETGLINIATPYHDYESEGAGTYQIRMRVTTPFMNTGYDNVGSVTVGPSNNPPVISNFSLVAENQVLIPGGARVDFDYNDSDGIVTDIFINWGDAPGGDATVDHLTPNDSSGSINKAFQYLSAGTYTVSVTIRDNDNDEDFDSDQVTVS